MIDIKEVVNKAQAIFGAFSPAESEILAQVSIECGKNAVFVEIGSYCGRSSSVLGMIAKENDCDLTCVDNFITIPEFLKTSEDVKNTFIKNMRSVNAQYNLLNMTSEEANKIYHKEIDLLFIDGDHSYEGVKLDCEMWIPKVKLNGFVLFHDYIGSWTGIKQTVDELDNLKRLSIVDSMLVTKKMYA